MTTPRDLYDAQTDAELSQSEIQPIPRPEHPAAAADELDPERVVGALVELQAQAAYLVNEYAARGCGSDYLPYMMRHLADRARDAGALLHPAPPPDAPEAAEVFFARALKQHDRVFLEDKGGWVLVSKVEQGRSAVTLHLDGCHGRDIHQAHTINADTPVVAWRGR